MECCNGMAQCLVGLKQWDNALLWLEEVNVLYKNGYFSAPAVYFGQIFISHLMYNTDYSVMNDGLRCNLSLRGF